MTNEEIYIETRLSIWDRICAQAWLIPVFAFFIQLANWRLGDWDKRVLVGVFVMMLGLAILLRWILLPRKIKRLRLEFANRPAPPVHFGLLLNHNADIDFRGPFYLKLSCGCAKELKILPLHDSCCEHGNFFVKYE